MRTSLKNTWKWISLLAVASLVVVGFFIGYAAYAGFHGFPLDDAWIHQVYARNLAQHGDWAFNPGQPSGGSTSPLWSILLSGAYVLRIDPVIWAVGLGWLALLATACLAESLMREWISGYQPVLPWIGLFLLTEWHLVWASVSGMETALFICLIFSFFFEIQKDNRQYWVAGLLIGVSTWVRPDGVTLLGPAILILFLEIGPLAKKLRQLCGLLGAFLILFLPYLLFNLNLAGSIWPSTFSAKQAEYLASSGLPFFDRLWSLFLPFLAGGGVVLLPAVFLAPVLAWKRKKILIISIFLWFGGYLLMYAIKLPVFYQHGRYMMPAMACFFLVGLWGLVEWISGWKDTMWPRLIKKFWTVCLAAVTLVFLVVGGLTYQNDVAIIETEMVETAGWVRNNTPSEKLVAAHDIGAMGYFSGHTIIDLAGLVNPEVIPIIRNEEKLKDYLDSRKVDILVTFPGWYPQLVLSRQPVYRSAGEFSPLSGGENMAVYEWK
jgi:hypothetical protein